MLGAKNITSGSVVLDVIIGVLLATWIQVAAWIEPDPPKCLKGYFYTNWASYYSYVEGIYSTTVDCTRDYGFLICFIITVLISSSSLILTKLSPTLSIDCNQVVPMTCTSAQLQDLIKENCDHLSSACSELRAFLRKHEYAVWHQWDLGVKIASVPLTALVLCIEIAFLRYGTSFGRYRIIWRIYRFMSLLSFVFAVAELVLRSMNLQSYRSMAKRLSMLVI